MRSGVPPEQSVQGVGVAVLCGTGERVAQQLGPKSRRVRKWHRSRFDPRVVKRKRVRHVAARPGGAGAGETNELGLIAGVRVLDQLRALPWRGWCGGDPLVLCPWRTGPGERELQS